MDVKIRTGKTLALLAVTLCMTMGSASAQIAWQKDLVTAHAVAEAQGKQILMHFYTDNCVYCTKLEQGAFQNPQVAQAINTKFVPVRVNAAKNERLRTMFDVNRFPSDVIVGVDGKKLAHTVSPQDPARYIAMLANVPIQNPPSYAQPGAVPPQHQPQPTSNLPVQVNASNPVRNNPMMNPAAAQGMNNQFVMPANTGQAPGQLAGARLDTAAPKHGLQGPSQNTTSPDSLAEPEFAVQGFCVVTVIDEDRWVEGKPEHGVIHLGKLYLFDTAEKMQAFLKDPVPYTPILNELDVVRFFEERKIVKGKREFGLKDPVHNRMFFFADEAAMNHFLNQYERYTDAAIDVMKRAIQDSNPGT